MSGTMELLEQMYLGDGVYVGVEQNMIWLYTSDGYEVTNKIALEPIVLEAFNIYQEKLKEGRSNHG